MSCHEACLKIGAPFAIPVISVSYPAAIVTRGHHAESKLQNALSFSGTQIEFDAAGLARGAEMRTLNVP